MIRSRQDYLDYLEADRRSLDVADTLFQRLFNDRWQYQRLLRKVEFLKNCRKNKALRLYAEWRFRKLGRLLGYSIPPNVFGPGLAIPHRGTIVVNSYARIGANCRIHVCTNIGTNLGTLDEAPVIGNNVYIGPGAKLYGKIVLGDNMVIGANAVVNRSFPEGNCTIAGAPAKVISDRTSAGGLVRGHQQTVETAEA
ncbi:serine O-acetyltransferase [Andreprevotia lacus DSM 23236]|jgi:serine O-acetyltransferase|uniref:Serine O-acetyltransferase n=1 Tax=Andreprevotia lacus DSM 23236 TaxID=1121001 RepID=A0A1W1XGH8_9NEIS|nr:serine acetyltransferase [Andreprevotia lacus]SMC23050.1 serine O-acetyltransferase [Andreprevotia lacus DSM 23236]